MEASLPSFSEDKRIYPKERYFVRLLAMQLSIVIPAKNEELLVPRLLASIRAQKFTDYEIILADAKSTDATARKAAQFGAQVVEGGLPGPGRNRGAAHARGEYLLFLDADVLLLDPAFLEDGLQEMRARNLDVGTCRVSALHGTTTDRAFHEAYNIYTLATEPILPHATGSCLWVRRTVHEELGGFDEVVVFAEDHDYARRAKKRDFTVGILRKHKIAISTRRYRKEGMMQVAAKFMFSELYMVTLGSFKRLPFKYEFGEFDEQDKVAVKGPYDTSS